MDNRHFDITMQGQELFRKAFGLILAREDGTRRHVTHYQQLVLMSTIRDGRSSLEQSPDGTPTMIFYSHYINGSTVFPYPLAEAEAVGIAWGWLNQLPEKSWGRPPNLDGHAEKGWRIFVEPDNHILRNYGATVAGIQPAWAEYHK